MTTIVAPPSNASKWQMGFNSAFKGLTDLWYEKKWVTFKFVEQLLYVLREVDEL
jgi:hypothetical protein